jgi:hypothetical protein
MAAGAGQRQPREQRPVGLLVQVSAQPLEVVPQLGHLGPQLGDISTQFAHLGTQLGLINGPARAGAPGRRLVYERFS